MNRNLFAVTIALLLVLSACQSAFELPAGCESEESVVESVPVSEESIVEVPEKTELKESVSSDKMPVKTVLEGQLVSFPNLKAIDLDGDKITYTFTPPLDNQGRWRTKVGDAGEHVVSITASDGKSKATQKVKIVVVAKNKAPVIQPIPDIMLNEGETVNLDPVVTDAENDKVELSFSGWMSSPTKKTTFGDAGKYQVTIRASDGTSTSSSKVNVVVNKVNRAPVLELISDIVIKEGDKITVKPEASDADRDSLSFSFSAPLNANGVWETKIGDAGNYQVKVTVSDGEAKTTAEFKVTVESSNRPPVLSLKQFEINVEEGDVVTIPVEVSDPDGDSVRVSYSGWMEKDTYETDFDDAGVHTVTVTATDGINTVTKDVQVTVRNVNRAPVFTAESFE
ncbi:hypothetical protein HY484_01400 [Candidatus Woesearchaeota archaeon]|nr:hypothetical protein [Candidatus Woesearchaeota archaeon]